MKQQNRKCGSKTAYHLHSLSTSTNYLFCVQVAKQVQPNSLVWKKTNGELCWESRVLCFGGMICICLWWVLLSGGDTVDGGRWTVDLVVMAEDEKKWSRESLMRLCESDYQHVSNNWIYIYFYNASLNR